MFGGACGNVYPSGINSRQGWFWGGVSIVIHVRLPSPTAHILKPQTPDPSHQTSDLGRPHQWIRLREASLGTAHLPRTYTEEASVRAEKAAQRSRWRGSTAAVSVAL